MANNEKKPNSEASAVKKNIEDIAKSTASGMQSLAKKTAKGAQTIAKSTAKNAQEIAKTTAKGAQNIAKTTAKGAQNIAKSTAESVKQAKAKKESEAASKPAQQKKKSTKKKASSLGLKFLSGALLRKMAFGGAKQLGSNADEVNKLNVFPVPDGDTGDNMRMTIESGIAAIENMDSDDLAEVMKALSHGMLLGARGNSGVILSQFFAGIAKGLDNDEKADAETFGHALELGVKQAYSSVMTPTEGTILTVAREAVEYAVSRINSESTIRSLFADLVKEMHASLDRTPEMLAALKEAGVVDSGGAGLLYIMDGFNRVLNGEDLGGESLAEKVAKAPQTGTSIFDFGPDSVMEYGYCTECLLRLQNAKTDIEAFDVEALKAFLASLGDSIVAFKNDSIVKLHVHTFTPEKVLEYCRQYGEFLTIKIENMSVQHSESSEKAANEEKKTEEAPVSNQPKKRYGMIAVSNGAGVSELFGELGVDAIVEGGQTQNPSTNDFLDAFAKVNAEHIFVFPNNGNIFMAASQAAELWEHAEIHVIPSKNIGMGYVAMSSANLDNDDVDVIVVEMNEAMKRVTTGYVSPSIRDADLNGIHIDEGDTIGIIDKAIVLSEKARKDAVHGLASMLLDMPEKFMLTVFVGADATEEERAELETFVNEKYPDDEIYFINGGQDIYPFIFVAE